MSIVRVAADADVSVMQETGDGVLGADPHQFVFVGIEFQPVG